MQVLFYGIRENTNVCTLKMGPKMLDMYFILESVLMILFKMLNFIGMSINSDGIHRKLYHTTLQVLSVTCLQTLTHKHIAQDTENSYIIEQRTIYAAPASAV